MGRVVVNCRCSARAWNVLAKAAWLLRLSLGALIIGGFTPRADPR